MKATLGLIDVLLFVTSQTSGNLIYLFDEVRSTNVSGRTDLLEPKLPRVIDSTDNGTSVPHDCQDEEADR